MNRTALLSFLIVVAGTASLLATTAHSQIGAPKATVNLQPTTPGTSQSGHSNISGTSRAGQFVGGGSGLSNVNAALLSGLPSSAFLQSVPVPLILTGNTNGQLLRADNIATGNGATAIYGLASGTSGLTWGVRGDSQSVAGYGVYGLANASSGVTYGGRFESLSASGYGVYGSGGQVGVFGIATNLSGTAYGGFFQTSSPNSSAVFATQTATAGSGAGGWFQSSGADGIGVYGWARDLNGQTSGVVGQTDSPLGAGVKGLATATFGANDAGYFQNDSANGRGATGYATSASGGINIGLNGISAGSVGRGVQGLATSTSGATVGVRGQATSDSGIGVEGRASAGSGSTFGGYFTSDSTNGVGAYGRSFKYGVQGEAGALGIAVYGHSLNGGFGSGDGVYGQSDGTNGRGVVGYAPANTGLTYAVVGYCQSTSGYGVFSFGNTGASGTKSFRIDHPMDPENKYLLHYSTEMPEPQNAYNGVITTDASGRAWVQLPDYFEAINRDFRYQLTVVDDAESAEFVQVKVGRKIRDNRFLILSSAPHVEVSWEVKAIRNDAWVQKYGAPSVVDKQGIEKGVYQRPELYGMPKERGMNFRAAPTQRQPKP